MKRFCKVFLIFFVVLIAMAACLTGGCSKKDNQPYEYSMTPEESATMSNFYEFTDGIANKLSGFMFGHMPDSVKTQIAESIESKGGIIEFGKEYWVITMEDYTAHYYPDETYTIFDLNGNIIETTHEE